MYIDDIPIYSPDFATHVQHVHLVLQRLSLPETCWINSIDWDFDKELENNFPAHIPVDCPADKKYIPPQLRNKLIAWTHNSPASEHPGTKRSSELIQNKYWWESMAKEINKMSCNASYVHNPRYPVTFQQGN